MGQKEMERFGEGIAQLADAFRTPDEIERDKLSEEREAYMRGETLSENHKIGSPEWKYSKGIERTGK